MLPHGRTSSLLELECEAPHSAPQGAGSRGAGAAAPREEAANRTSVEADSHRDAAPSGSWTGHLSGHVAEALGPGQMHRVAGVDAPSGNRTRLAARPHASGERPSLEPSNGSEGRHLADEGGSGRQYLQFSLQLAVLAALILFWSSPIRCSGAVPLKKFRLCACCSK
jgi:hypothetical protein